MTNIRSDDWKICISTFTRFIDNKFGRLLTLGRIISTQTLKSLPTCCNFSDIEMSWRHQMPKHETRNTYWILGSKHGLVMKFGQLMKHYKMNFLSKSFMKNVAWKLVPDLVKNFRKSFVKRILTRSACWFKQILMALLLHV